MALQALFIHFYEGCRIGVPQGSIVGLHPSYLLNVVDNIFCVRNIM